MSTGTKKRHMQVWVKINAHVDSTIANLVSALSMFPALQTIESCQSTPAAGAWVCFRYGEDEPDAWRELAAFVLGYFGPQLAKKIGDLATITIVVLPCGLVQAEITVHHEALAKTAKTVHQLAVEFNKKGSVIK